VGYAPGRYWAFSHDQLYSDSGCQRKGDEWDSKCGSRAEIVARRKSREDFRCEDLDTQQSGHSKLSQGKHKDDERGCRDVWSD
jgi:hypothetical protein